MAKYFRKFFALAVNDLANQVRFFLYLVRSLPLSLSMLLSCCTLWLANGLRPRCVKWREGACMLHSIALTLRTRWAVCGKDCSGILSATHCSNPGRSSRPEVSPSRLTSRTSCGGEKCRKAYRVIVVKIMELTLTSIVVIRLSPVCDSGKINHGLCSHEVLRWQNGSP